MVLGQGCSDCGHNFQCSILYCTYVESNYSYGHGFVRIRLVLKEWGVFLVRFYPNNVMSLQCTNDSKSGFYEYIEFLVPTMSKNCEV